MTNSTCKLEEIYQYSHSQQIVALWIPTTVLRRLENCWSFLLLLADTDISFKMWYRLDMIRVPMIFWVNLQEWYTINQWFFTFFLQAPPFRHLHDLAPPYFKGCTGVDGIGLGLGGFGLHYCNICPNHCMHYFRDQNKVAITTVGHRVIPTDPGLIPKYISRFHLCGCGYGRVIRVQFYCFVRLVNLLKRMSYWPTLYDHIAFSSAIRPEHRTQFTLTFIYLKRRIQY